jgi:hypothetical protein
MCLPHSPNVFMKIRDSCYGSPYIWQKSSVHNRLLDFPHGETIPSITVKGLGLFEMDYSESKISLNIS